MGHKESDTAEAQGCIPKLLLEAQTKRWARLAQARAARLGCTSGVEAWGGGMGVEQEPALARLECLWGTLGTVRSRWEIGWSP